MANFIDYVTLLLTNMTAGLVVLAFFLWWGLGREDQAKWAPAFGISGLIAFIAGLAMTFTGPIPKPFASAYGEMSVLFGVLFLGAAWALAHGWSLVPLGIYAFVPGLAAIVIGVRFLQLSLTPAPLLAGAGFIVTGCGGIFAGLVLSEYRVASLRIVGGIVMFAAALIWVPTIYMSYWVHMQVPPEQKSASAAPANPSSTASPSLGGPAIGQSPSPDK
jgi:putative membrane protein